MPKASPSIVSRIPPVDFSTANVLDWREFCEAELAGLNPRYVAYVRAHDYQVPARRNDLFSAWLRKAWTVYFEDIGYKHPTPSFELKAMSYTPAELRDQAIIAAGDGFDAWILGKFPAVPRLEKAGKGFEI